MTRLLQWLLAFGIFLAVWIGFCLEYRRMGLSNAHYEVIIALPVYLLISFACYSLTVIGYRVYKFNDCEGAAKELKQEIEEARQDLLSKGFLAEE